MRTGELALAYNVANRWKQAAELNETILPRLTAKFGADHMNTLQIRNNLAEAYRMAGRLDEAIAHSESTTRDLAAKLGPSHPVTLSSRDSLAEAHHDAGHTAEAIALHELNVDLSAAKLGEGHAYTLDSRHNLAATYSSAGRHREAEPLWRALVSSCRKASEPDDSAVARALGGLGTTLLAQGKADAAEPFLRESLALREKAAPDAWTTFESRSLLGAALMAQGKSAEAKPLLHAGYEGMNARTDKIPWAARSRITAARDRQIAADRTMNKPTESAGQETPGPRGPAVTPD
jgi:tetratricopeptide (TPR) repeat protein